ncbi:MAG TPA: Stk1 family PASTA domain-containing Ser/Thr kinase [Micromonosporaceae bacterium]|nr:Stk1 family PASTA domain-containing Ser/Thr kinase [Micromonosporaceae bacterium]
MTAQARVLGGGRYQVGELLGYGGMAEVHRGRDLRLGRDVAIKMLRSDLARDATFQMRFRREAQNAASLNHPAIVAVYDTGEERGPTGETLPYIVMEFVNGRTLKEVLAAEGRLMPRRALEIMADICAALDFSHRHGIIHRDIKPGNVMLTQTGQVKVMDFGIARALASGATTMTQTSAVIGTAQYLSPEQARGEAVDARSDVYAAGCVLYELLCGHPPFVGDSPVSVAYQHVREDPRPPSDANRDVTPDIDAVVLKALAKNPLNRYQSAGEMRADVLRAAAGRPVMATPVMRPDDVTAMVAPPMMRPQGAPTRAMPARVGDAKRRRASAWVLAVLSALGVLAVIALGYGLYLANQDGNETQQQIAVPDVVGKTRQVAESELTGLGLKPKLGDSLKNRECKVNNVESQNPVANTRVEPSTEVTLTICAGPNTQLVPDLRGVTKAQADSQLKGLGFKPKFEEVDSGEPKDTVVGIPDSGKTLPEGSEVVVRISKANQVKVPSLVGKTRSAAEALLDQAGLDVRVVDGDVVPADQAGTVSQQNPPAGRTVKRGSTVTIWVDIADQTPPTQTPTASPT